MQNKQWRIALIYILLFYVSFDALPFYCTAYRAVKDLALRAVHSSTLGISFLRRRTAIADLCIGATLLYALHLGLAWVLLSDL